jgi:hypothetical protein
MIERAFRNLPFARPRVHVQPEGNITLVNLATYYEVRWPVRGYQPGEVAHVTLLGRRIDIRPRADGYTYAFGDGNRLGPTSSPGGTYPSGDITHTYRRTGRPEVQVVSTYSGQYRLPGGGWRDIDVSVPIAGPAQPLQVKEAHAVLVDGR